MPEQSLRLVVRTPGAVVVDQPVRAARLPTETGLVGLRPGLEPMVCTVEPGVMLLRNADEQTRFVVTAGGLLECNRDVCTLYTPQAAVGDTEAEMLEALERMNTAPSDELLARRRLGELEQRIVHELGERPDHRARAGRRTRA